VPREAVVVEQKRRQVLSGVALIAVGLALYVAQQVESLGASAAFFVVGGAFLAAYLYRRDFGLLVPGALVSGLGVGMLESVPMLIGIGSGFVALTVLALICERRFEGWPLIPGVILILIGLRESRILDYLLDHWPLLVVAAGVLIVLGALGRRAPRPG
jgi:hypothetical protein